MKWFDFTFDSPAENLACDEALLDLCEHESVEVLRFWESRAPFVVVGYGNRIESEVNVEECRRRGVPILRRCSGGGTVVQGRGCLNYNLTLKIPDNGPLTSVTGTNEFVMERNRAALEQLLSAKVSIQGHTDLAFPGAVGRAVLSVPERTDISQRGEHTDWFKFSGNAQRRRRRALVFHGTFLHGFDLALIDALLCFPSAQPHYRAYRSHADFVRNVPANATDIKKGLREAWDADLESTAVPSLKIAALVRDQYANPDWIFRR